MTMYISHKDCPYIHTVEYCWGNCLNNYSNLTLFFYVNYLYLYITGSPIPLQIIMYYSCIPISKFIVKKSYSHEYNVDPKPQMKLVISAVSKNV